MPSSCSYSGVHPRNGFQGLVHTMVIGSVPGLPGHPAQPCWGPPCPLRFVFPSLLHVPAAPQCSAFGWVSSSEFSQQRIAVVSGALFCELVCTARVNSPAAGCPRFTPVLSCVEPPLCSLPMSPTWKEVTEAKHILGGDSAVGESTSVSSSTEEEGFL